MDQKPDNDFETIVSNYYQPLYRFGYSLAKNEHEASDLTQQTFFIYAEKGNSLRDPSKLKSWLFTTLYREFLRHRNKAKRIAHYEPELLENVGGSVEPHVQSVTDGNLAIEALQEVDATYREPLTLFYIKDLSYKEIAKVLAVPMGTVMSRISRGKEQLRTRFKRKEAKHS